MHMPVLSGPRLPACGLLDATRTPFLYSFVVVPSSVAAMCTQELVSPVLDGPVTQSNAQNR